MDAKILRFLQIQLLIFYFFPGNGNVPEKKIKPQLSLNSLTLVCFIKPNDKISHKSDVILRTDLIN